MRRIMNGLQETGQEQEIIDYDKDSFSMAALPGPGKLHLQRSDGYRILRLYLS